MYYLLVGYAIFGAGIVILGFRRLHRIRARLAQFGELQYAYAKYLVETRALNGTSSERLHRIFDCVNIQQVFDTWIFPDPFERAIVDREMYEIIVNYAQHVELMKGDET